MTDIFLSFVLAPAIVGAVALVLGRKMLRPEGAEGSTRSPLRGLLGVLLVVFALAAFACSGLGLSFAVSLG